ncbi:MAG: hypothetical protein K8R90_09740 [Candidatus Cloacimonetes bacterium]|nr:hypothetical protein [Candidatus Cloacimonadota bacterium]
MTRDVNNKVQRGSIMSKMYSEKETKNRLQSELINIDSLYTAECVNNIGITNDTRVLYTEIIAQELLKNLTVFNSIKSVKRTSSYYRPSHSKISINLLSSQKENIFAKRIAYLEFKEMGKILDYQIPLQDTNSDTGIGSIDLISFHEERRILFLIELKNQGNKEPLLRALLESYTYYNIVDKDKLVKDFIMSNIMGEIESSKIKVIPAVLVTPSCKAYDELKDMKVGNRPKLKALSLALGISFFTLEFVNHEVLL